MFLNRVIGGVLHLVQVRNKNLFCDMVFRRKLVSRPRRFTRRAGGMRRVGLKGRSRTRSTGIRIRRTRAPVATGVTMARQGRTGYRLRQVSASKMQVVGRSYLGSVDNLNLAATNQCIMGCWDVNPSLLGDRIAVISSTFEKYVFKKIKFTYVPQCSTQTKGSIGMVYERDPSAHLACPDAPHYLAQIMSYENAVLTPAWKGASNSVGRNKSERELYYIGGPSGQNDPRHFSQGLFVAYGTGLDTASQQSLGYIVIDYVLEFDTPSIIPALSGVTNYTKNAPGQYERAIGQGENHTILGDALKSIKVSNGVYAWRDFEVTKTGPLAEYHGCPGTIIEVVLESAWSSATAGTPSVTTYSQHPLVMNYLKGNGTGGGTTPSSSGVESITYQRGQRVYIAIQTLIDASDTDGTLTHTVANIYPTLPAAWSAAGDAIEHCAKSRTHATTPQDASGDTAGVSLFRSGASSLVSPGPPMMSGYVRVISRGIATQYTGYS